MADYRINQAWADANLVGQGWNGSDIASWAYYDDGVVPAGVIASVDLAGLYPVVTVTGSVVTAGEFVSNINLNGLYPVISASGSVVVPAGVISSVDLAGLYPVVTVTGSVVIPAGVIASVDLAGLYPVFTSIFSNGDDAIFILPQTNFHIPYKSSNIVIQTKTSNIKI